MWLDKIKYYRTEETQTPVITYDELYNVYLKDNSNTFLNVFVFKFSRFLDYGGWRSSDNIYIRVVTLVVKFRYFQFF